MCKYWWNIFSVAIPTSFWKRSVVRPKPKPVNFLVGKSACPFSSPVGKVGYFVVWWHSTFAIFGCTFGHKKRCDKYVWLSTECAKVDITHDVYHNPSHLIHWMFKILPKYFVIILSIKVFLSISWCYIRLRWSCFCQPDSVHYVHLWRASHARHRPHWVPCSSKLSHYCLHWRWHHQFSRCGDVGEEFTCLTHIFSAFPSLLISTTGALRIDAIREPSNQPSNHPHIAFEQSSLNIKQRSRIVTFKSTLRNVRNDFPKELPQNTTVVQTEHTRQYTKVPITAPSRGSLWSVSYTHLTLPTNREV